MFEQALLIIDGISRERQSALLVRLHVVRGLGHNLGYGVGDDMDDLLARHGFDAGP
jgi:hypothetical protein